MFYTVYKITNLVNKKIYIGVHKTENVNDSYMGSGKLIKRAIIKHGRENFIKEILFSFDNKEDAYQKEKSILTEEFITKNSNYNLAIGGCGGELNNTGRKHSERTKKIMSEKAKLVSDLTRKRRSESALGRKYSPEINAKKASKGSKNGNSRKVCIYTFSGELYCESNGNFKEMCELNDLPAPTISKLLRKGGGTLYEKSTKNVKENFKRLKGFKVSYK